jgi:hypothetical protein
MKIYLDTNHLIEIIQNSNPCSVDDFENILRTNGYELVLSLSNVMEFCRPLFYSKKYAGIMRSLRRIEKMPIVFISEVRIPFLELKEAIKNFFNKQEYNNISPFVNRFQDTFVHSDHSLTNMFVNFGLSETVYYLLMDDPKHFTTDDYYTKFIQQSIFSERSLQISPKDKFIRRIGHYLQWADLTIPFQLETFGEWIYSIDTRCPSIRLEHEVYEKLLKNTGYIPKNANDISDLAAIMCIPYVDVAALDKHMYNYFEQSCRSSSLNYERGVFNNRAELVDSIK